VQSTGLYLLYHECLVDISAVEYRHAVASGSEISFVCQDCKVRPSSPALSVSFEANASFDATGADVREESLLDDGDIEDDLPEQRQVPSFTEVDGGTKRGRRKLVDSDGFTYSVKRQ